MRSCFKVPQENILSMSGEGWSMFQVFLVLIGSILEASMEHVESKF
jgi:hypothetical protein